MSMTKRKTAAQRTRAGQAAKASRKEEIVMEQSPKGWGESPLRQAMKTVEAIEEEVTHARAEVEGHRGQMERLEKELKKTHTHFQDASGLLHAAEAKLSRALDDMRNESYKNEPYNNCKAAQVCEAEMACRSQGTLGAGKYR